jgi:hypothetical protein
MPRVIERDEEIAIASRDYWFTVTSFLQQNWALIDPTETGVTVWFFGDTSGVFDQLAFGTAVEAERALRRNGFRRYAEAPDAHEVIPCPEPPFWLGEHPSGPIYSSGRFWN